MFSSALAFRRITVDQSHDQALKTCAVVFFLIIYLSIPLAGLGTWTLSVGTTAESVSDVHLGVCVCQSESGESKKQKEQLASLKEKSD